MFDAISGAIYGPNSNGATGYAAKAASPFVSNQIGQYYKEQSETQGDSLTGIQQAGHILAHGILGAAVSYATGNDAVTGGISAGAGEATAPVLSKFLYGSSDPANLTAEQKDTISAITSAVGLTIGATTGNANDAANAAETSKVAVDNNHSADLRVDKQLGRVGKSPFNDKEARFIAASIGIVVWPVGVLDAYLKADSDADKILIIREAFGGIKARAISEALQEARGVKSSKNDSNGMEPDNDLYSNKPSGKQEYYNINQMSQTSINNLERQVRTRSPINIPDNVTPRIEQKSGPSGSGGYAQVRYKWTENGVRYESRWHTRTPNAPSAQGNSWVITRQVSGSKTTKSGELQYMQSNGTWVSGKEWSNAERARAKGNETIRQRQILDRGHISDK